MSIALLSIDVSIIVIPLVIVRFFPGTVLDQIGWIFPMWGVLILPFTFIFFLITFYFYNKKNRSLEAELILLKKSEVEKKRG